MCGGSTGTESLELWNDVSADGWSDLPWSGPGRSSQGGCNAEQSQSR